jgi:translocation protein SEC72
MVPMWSRAQRFSNIYAFAALDGVSVILWLSAWAAVASYVTEGKGHGKNEKAKGCDNFKFGSPARCNISQGTIFLGVILMLAFVPTTFISVKAILHFKRTGEMPDQPLGNDNLAKQTQDAFSSNMRNDDPLDDNQEDLDPRQGGRSGYEPTRRSEEDEYAPLHNNDHEDIAQAAPTQPAGPLGYGAESGGGMHGYDTSYGGPYGRHSPDGGYGNASYGR